MYSATKPKFEVGSDYWIREVFSYHAPTQDQVAKYNELRESAKAFAQSIVDNCPPSADRTAALRKVREAVMTANAAIALDGMA